MGRFTARWPAQLTATKTLRTCYPDHLSRFRPCCPERHFCHTWLISKARGEPQWRTACRLFKELCNLYSIIPQMYIKVVVKVQFFVGNGGCGSLTSERDTPGGKNIIWIWSIYFHCCRQSTCFSLCKARFLFFCLISHHVLYHVHNCTKQCLFCFYENIEHYINQKDTLNF